MVKVSVIVPIYNAEKHLEQCLNSIVSQTLKKIEIILIDDGSTDGSAEICKKYLSDSRVTYYHKENEGLAAARDDGMLRATGEYIGFVDSDDWIKPEMYEKMYNAAKSNDSDVVFCNCIQNENGYRFSQELPVGEYDRNKIKNEVLPKTLAFISKDGGKRAIRWSNCMRIYKAEALNKNGIKFDRRLRRSQDLQLTYEAMLVAQNFYYIDEPFYHNRVVLDSLSRGYTKNMWPLYTYLIEILYKDTENFKEMDLMDQMHLRAFFFATDGIENEMKPLCPNDKKTKIKLIEQIMNDPICERFYGHIPTEKLNPLYRKYYELIHKKKAAKILSFTKSYKRRQEFKKKYINPLINILTENALYKKIRGIN